MVQQIPPPDDSTLQAPVEVNPLQIQIDWNAYFDDFRELHGEPVTYKQRVLLFPDGWTYSMSDKSGPEWPPPSDPNVLHDLKVEYWLIRLRMVTFERNALANNIHQLREMQRVRKIPLKQLVTSFDEEGRLQRASVPINLDDLEGKESRLAWLSDDIVQCERELAKLHERKDANEATSGSGV